MSPFGANVEEQLSSIMDVLSKAAVSEISQLFSEGSATLRLQITQSLKENEALRTRMKAMRSELFSLRLQTRSNASRAASRFALARANICKPRTKALGNGLKPLMNHKAVGHSPSHPPSKSEISSDATPAEESPEIILIKDEEDMRACSPAAENGVNSGDCSTPRGATTESPRADAAGSSHMSAHDEALRILSVHGQGEGPLAADGHDTLFTASELEALSSLSPDHSITHDSLLSFNSGPSERVPTQGMQHGRGGPGRDGQAERGQRLQAAAATLSLKHSAPGGPADEKGRRPSHFVAQFPPHHSVVFPQGVAQSLDCDQPFYSREEPAMHPNEEPPFPCALCGKLLANRSKLTMHMRIHNGEKPYVCVQCGKHFSQSGSLKIHLRTHSGEKPCVCLHCHARFGDPSNLRRHMVKHTGSGLL